MRYLIFETSRDNCQTYLNDYAENYSIEILGFTYKTNGECCILAKIKHKSIAWVDKILNKNMLFVKSYEPFDFSKNMGQLAVKIEYTDGDTQMLSTKSTKDNVSGSFDFACKEDFYAFIEFLTEKEIPRKY